jgi:hypothetical protein
LIWLLPTIIGICGQAGSFHWWQRAGMIAVMMKETAGMFALETPTR